MIFPTEQDLFFVVDSDGLIAVAANTEVILCSRQLMSGKNARIRYIGCAPELTTDWSTSEFYIRINKSLSVQGFDSIKIPTFPIGNSKEIFIEAPSGCLIELCGKNTAGVTKNFQGYFEGWEFTTI